MTAGSLQRAGAVVALMVVLGLLAGCSGGSEPATSPPSTPMASSASPSASAPSTTTAVAAPYKPADLNGPAQNVPKPVKPALADEFSEKGLDAFVRYWYAAYNYLQETGDVQMVQEITDYSCSRCNGSFSDLVDLYIQGNWRAGGLVVVSATKPNLVKTASGVFQALVQFDQKAGGDVRQDHSMPSPHPELVARGDVIDATFVSGQWRVVNIGRIG